MGPDQHYLEPISALLGAYEKRLDGISTNLVMQQRLWTCFGTQRFVRESQTNFTTSIADTKKCIIHTMSYVNALCHGIEA